MFKEYGEGGKTEKTESKGSKFPDHEE